MTTVEELLSEAGSLLWAGLHDPVGSTPADARAALRFSGRVLESFVAAGFGTSPFAAERARLARAAAAQCADVSVGSDGETHGRAGALAGAAADALRTMDPPLSPDERWAAMTRLQEIVSLAADVVAVVADAPDVSRLRSTAIVVAQRSDADPPAHSSWARLDSVIPSAATDLILDRAAIAGELSVLANQLRRPLASGVLTVFDARITAAAALRVAHDARQLAMLAGRDDLADEAFAAARDWHNIKYVLNDLDDGLRHVADPVLLTRVERLTGPLAAVPSPDWVGRLDWPGIFAASADSVAELPAIAGALADGAARWGSDPVIHVRYAPEQTLFLAARYAPRPFAEPAEPEVLEVIAGGMTIAQRSSAILSVAMDRGTGAPARPHLSAANRSLAGSDPVGSAVERLLTESPAELGQRLRARNSTLDAHAYRPRPGRAEPVVESLPPTQMPSAGI